VKQSIRYALETSNAPDTVSLPELHRLRQRQCRRAHALGRGVVQKRGPCQGFSGIPASRCARTQTMSPHSERYAHLHHAFEKLACACIGESCSGMGMTVTSARTRHVTDQHGLLSAGRETAASGGGAMHTVGQRATPATTLGGSPAQVSSGAAVCLLSTSLFIAFSSMRAQHRE
jgi:hypothetical protein